MKFLLKKRLKMGIEKQLRELLVGTQENELLEFKEAKNSFDFDKLGKYFSALSNEANLKGVAVAWLVFGIRDDKTIVGTQFRVSKSKLQNLKLEMATSTTGQITFREIHELDLTEGRVIVFEVPSASKGIPTGFKGHYYARLGESLTALTIEKQERIRLQNQHHDWSAQIIENASTADLSTQAIVKAREEYTKKNPSLLQEINTWDDITFLNKAKITIKGKITHAAILLLGLPESEHLCSANTQITWILKSKENIEKDYEHFCCPLLLAVPKVFNKIRNLKYRYLQHGTIFPEELDRYDPYVIREALHNCIAHQDYSLRRRIVVVEKEDEHLIFSNAGNFIPVTVENVIITDAPEYNYRNQFLVNAMVNLGMIDTIGSGIKRMFVIQKNRLFPLPDYHLQEDTVKVTITGKIIDLNYAQKLLSNRELDLMDIILLDRVAKKKLLTKEQIKKLRKKKLIEGRKPNFYISAGVATKIGEEGEYIKKSGFEDEYYMDMIVKYLKKFKEANKKTIDKLLVDKLPDALHTEQKKNKVKNILQKMKREKLIKLGDGRMWTLV